MPESKSDYEALQRKLRRRDAIQTACTYLFLSVWAVVVLFPFYWMVLTSLEKLRGLQLGAYAGLFHLAAHAGELCKRLHGGCRLGGYLLNTLIFSVATTAIMVVTTTLAAYAVCEAAVPRAQFSVRLFPLHDDGSRPSLSSSQTLFTITNLDLRNSFLGLILPSITSVFYTYLLKENFEQVPDELYKAAKVDGTSDLKYLWKVMIPICRPTIVTITILKLIECWNSYVWPRLITDDPGVLPCVKRYSGNP